jgi:hypothetical protein
MTYLAVAAVALTTVSFAAAASPGPVYSRADLARIVDPKPRFAGWSFSRSQYDPDPAFTLRESLPSDPQPWQRALFTKLTKAGFLGGRSLIWHRGQVRFMGWANLFRNEAGAVVGARLLLPSFGPRAHATSGFGSQAWAMSDPQGANVWWRRGNVVFEVVVACNDYKGPDCPFNPMTPARAYASQIDIRAKQFA